MKQHIVLCLMFICTPDVSSIREVLHCVTCRNLKIADIYVDIIMSLVEMSLLKYFNQPDVPIHEAALGCIESFNFSVSILYSLNLMLFDSRFFRYIYIYIYI